MLYAMSGVVVGVLAEVAPVPTAPKSSKNKILTMTAGIMPTTMILFIVGQSHSAKRARPANTSPALA